MTEMVLATKERTHPTLDSGDEHHRGVKYGDTENDDGHEVLRDLRDGGAHLQPEVCHKESDEQTARITHVDGCGMEVGPQESEHATGKPDRKQSAELLVVDDGDEKEGHARHRRGSGREAVDVVEEVERIRDTDDPHDGDGHVDPVRHRRDEMDAVHHDDDSNCQFDEEPREGAEAAQVVDEPHRTEQQCEPEDDE